tara:strand:+ start:6667 stop:7092 length:426 start_codon:yes stop_codon:yes gene_type:complete
MGLDCYIMKGNRDEMFKDERLKDCSLTGGLFFSGQGNGSFRGGCYESFVASLIGEREGIWHLDEDEVIPSDELERYADALDEYIEQNLAELPDDEKIEWQKFCNVYPEGGPIFDYTVKEIKDLALMFRVAAEHKCVMETWW